MHQAPDIFEKCYKYTHAHEVMQRGDYPYFQEIESPTSTEIYSSGHKMLMLGSNDYLSLTKHPEVKEAAKRALDEYGTGNSGSRLLNGTLRIHCELEDKLSEFFCTEKSLLYGTGYMTNVGVISALAGPQDCIITDKANHASIFEALQLSYAKTIKYRHADMDSLEEALRVCETKYPTRGKLIVTDGVFSMEGDIAKLPEIVALKKKYNARLLVDDAHAVGVLGEGRGTGSHFNLQQEIDLTVLTFSKTLASLGGAVLATDPVIHYLKHHSRALIFSASMPPANVATVLKALEIMQREPERLEKLWYNTRKMKKAFQELGYRTHFSNTPIIPLIMDSDTQGLKLRRLLIEQGVFVNIALRPAVDNCLIRTSYMTDHTEQQLDYALECFEKAGKTLGII